MISSTVRLGGSLWAADRQGIVSNITNPKVALFFLAFMPQFIEPASSSKVAAFMVLGLSFIATGTVWCLVLAVTAARAKGMLGARPKVGVWLARVTGAVFVALGLRLAVSRT